MNMTYTVPSTLAECDRRIAEIKAAVAASAAPGATMKQYKELLRLYADRRALAAAEEPTA